MYKDENGRSLSAASGSEQGSSVAAVSSESSLDSFIMGLPAANELPKFSSRRSEQRQPAQERATSSSSTKPEVKLPTFTRPSHTHIANTSPHSIPDFLYQLTKMLADENSDIIEWNNGRIEVHNPHRLETEVLHKYFRHSKFASLQRQLNYFGFRKIAGKGKMAPCSYVNESARGDLSSLIYIKRKGSVSGPDPVDKPNKRKASNAPTPRAGTRSTRSSSATDDAAPSSSDHAMPALSTTSLTSQQALARSAAGRGIRHGWSADGARHHVVDSDPADTGAMSDSTNDDHFLHLERDYSHHVNGNDQAISSSSETDLASLDESAFRPTYGFLSRNSSLVDLAMIPEVEEESTSNTTNHGLTFVDFPNVPNDAGDVSSDGLNF